MALVKTHSAVMARYSVILCAVSLCLPAPAAAQFGMFNDIARGATSSTSSNSDDGCKTEGGKRKKAILGSVIGGVASRAGVTRFVPMSAFADTLSAAIACKLDPKEQEQAAGATTKVLEADRGGTANWTSSTRENVSGSSTASKPTQLADGMKCVTVTDVVIVDGEETKAEKRMCRGPGQPRYVLQA